MANAPTINTASWRLPKRAHSAPEATFTDDMYRAKGLPVDPERLPTTGGSGRSVVDTTEWRLPTKEEREAKALEEAKERHHAKNFEVELDDSEFDDLDDEYNDDDYAGLEEPEPKKSKAESRMQEIKTCKGSYLKRSAGLKVKGQQGRGRGRGVGRGEGPIGRQDAGPPRAADDDAVDEVTSLRHIQRQLAGLEESRGLEFAIGQPYRRLPGPLTEMDRTGFSGQTPENKAYNVIMSAGMVSNTAHAKKEIEALAKKLRTTMPHLISAAFERHLQALKGGARPVTGTQNDMKREMAHMAKAAKALGAYELLVKAAKKYSPKRESEVPREQQALAGMTERAPLPHPMTDTRPVGPRPAHGILDDGTDSGESYVDKILAESRWFFDDGPGATRPFDEAPGGRAGPWRGSDDEPAKTPIVRKGKVKGTVGQAKGGDKGEPEEEPEDDDAGDGEKKQVPPKGKGKSKGKPKAPPEEEPDEDEEQDEGVLGERDSGAAHGLKSLGHHLKAAGHRAGHGSMAQSAKAGLHHHLQKFAKKHGIKAFGHEPEKAEPKAKAKPKKSAIKAKAKPKTKPKPLKLHTKALKKSRAAKAKAAKAGTAPKLKKMKRKLREILDLGPPNILL